MRSIQIIILILVLSVSALSCSDMDDFHLSETIFIEDPYFPSLPIYSEWGYNTFGAYIDRKPFVSTNSDLPTKIIVNGDTLNILLRGQMNYQNVDLWFSIKGFSPPTHVELLELNDIHINLKDPGTSVSMKTGNVYEELRIIEGEIHIKRVQHLYLDENPVRIIMSGYFQFKTFLNQEPISITNGRFDLGFGYENFYNY
jgi:hypothetical protein